MYRYFRYITIKKNIIYKLEIDIECYCKNNLDEKFKNIEVVFQYIRGFQRDFFISDFSNFYMYLNLFTLTGLLFVIINKKIMKLLNI